MLYNQVVLEFLGEELVVSLMYVFWLMLGLVLFKSFKDLYEFLKAIVLGIWFGIRWTGLKLWFAIRWVGKYLAIFGRWIWQGLRWLGLKIYKGLQWLWKIILKVWGWMKKTAIVIGLTIWKGLIMVGNFFKAVIQWSWWILAGVAIAIFEAVVWFFVMIGKLLTLAVQYLGIGLRWLVYPFFALYQWLLSKQKGKQFKLVCAPWWVKTKKWFNLQWRTLLFKTKTIKSPKVVKEKVKPVVQKPAVIVDDHVELTTVKDVNQANVEKVKAAFAREEAMDDVASTKEAKLFESRIIFTKPVQGNPEFYNRLSPMVQQEFAQFFTSVQPNRVIQDVTYVIGGQNDGFFAKVFNFIYRIRKTISLGLLEALIAEGLRLANDDGLTKTNIYEAGIRVAYARRSNLKFLAYAKQLSQLDATLHFDVLKSTKRYVYSVKRLAIILEKQEAFAEAITLVNQAIRVGLLDQTEGEYAARLKRLQAQLVIAEAKKQGLFVEKTITPVITAAPAVEDETEEATSVDLSSLEVKETGFYEGLTPVLKSEFDRYFVLEGEAHLVKGLVFVPGQPNATFYQNVFNSLYAYRKVISFDLLMAIYEEIKQQLVGRPNLLTAINEATIRILFYRRKDPIFLETCETLCQEDIALHLDVLKTRKGFVYSFKRLAILLEKQGLYEDAIAMCDRALNLNLDDKTQGGYAGRKQRILKRQESQTKEGA